MKQCLDIHETTETRLCKSAKTSKEEHEEYSNIYLLISFSEVRAGISHTTFTVHIFLGKYFIIIYVIGFLLFFVWEYKWLLFALNFKQL